MNYRNLDRNLDDPPLPIVYSSPEIDEALKQAGIPKAWIRFTPHESGRKNRWRMYVEHPEHERINGGVGTP